MTTARKSLDELKDKIAAKEAEGRLEVDKAEGFVFPDTTVAGFDPNLGALLDALKTQRDKFIGVIIETISENDGIVTDELEKNGATITDDQFNEFYDIAESNIDNELTNAITDLKTLNTEIETALNAAAQTVITKLKKLQEALSEPLPAAVTPAATPPIHELVHAADKIKDALNHLSPDAFTAADNNQIFNALTNAESALRTLALTLPITSYEALKGEQEKLSLLIETLKSNESLAVGAPAATSTTPTLSGVFEELNTGHVQPLIEAAAKREADEAVKTFVTSVNTLTEEHLTEATYLKELNDLLTNIKENVALSASDDANLKAICKEINEIPSKIESLIAKAESNDATGRDEILAEIKKGLESINASLTAAGLTEIKVPDLTTPTNALVKDTLNKKAADALPTIFATLNTAFDKKTTSTNDLKAISDALNETTFTSCIEPLNTGTDRHKELKAKLINAQTSLENLVTEITKTPINAVDLDTKRKTVATKLTELSTAIEPFTTGATPFTDAVAVKATIDSLQKVIENPSDLTKEFTDLNNEIKTPIVTADALTAIKKAADTNGLNLHYPELHRALAKVNAVADKDRMSAVDELKTCVNKYNAGVTATPVTPLLVKLQALSDSFNDTLKTKNADDALPSIFAALNTALTGKVASKGASDLNSIKDALETAAADSRLTPSTDIRHTDLVAKLKSATADINAITTTTPPPIGAALTDAREKLSKTLSAIATEIAKHDKTPDKECVKALEALSRQVGGLDLLEKVKAFVGILSAITSGTKDEARNDAIALLAQFASALERGTTLKPDEALKIYNDLSVRISELGTLDDPSNTKKNAMDGILDHFSIDKSMLAVNLQAAPVAGSPFKADELVAHFKYLNDEERGRNLSNLLKHYNALTEAGEHDAYARDKIPKTKDDLAKIKVNLQSLLATLVANAKPDKKTLDKIETTRKQIEEISKIETRIQDIEAAIAITPTQSKIVYREALAQIMDTSEKADNAIEGYLVDKLSAEDAMKGSTSSTTPLTPVGSIASGSLSAGKKLASFEASKPLVHLDEIAISNKPSVTVRTATKQHRDSTTDTFRTDMFFAPGDTEKLRAVSSERDGLFGPAVPGQAVRIWAVKQIDKHFANPDNLFKGRMTINGIGMSKNMIEALILAAYRKDPEMRIELLNCPDIKRVGSTKEGTALYVDRSQQIFFNERVHMGEESDRTMSAKAVEKFAKETTARPRH